MRPRKARFLTQDHTTGKSQSQDMNQKYLALESVLLITMLCCLLCLSVKEGNILQLRY